MSRVRAQPGAKPGRVPRLSGVRQIVLGTIDQRILYEETMSR